MFHVETRTGMELSRFITGNYPMYLQEDVFSSKQLKETR